MSKLTNENTPATKLNAIKQAAGGALNKFNTAIGTAGPAFDGAGPAAELAGRVADQMANLFAELQSGAVAIGGEAQREFETLLRIVDPLKMIESFAKLLVGMAEAVAKLWIKLLQEIKKIIRALWEIVFGKLPKWLEMALLLIDELANDAVSLMFPKLAAELHVGEVAYLREIHAARRITLLDSRTRSEDDV